MQKHAGLASVRVPNTSFYLCSIVFTIFISLFCLNFLFLQKRLTCLYNHASIQKLEGVIFRPLPASLVRHNLEATRSRKETSRAPPLPPSPPTPLPRRSRHAGRRRRSTPPPPELARTDWIICRLTNAYCPPTPNWVYFSSIEANAARATSRGRRHRRCRRREGSRPLKNKTDDRRKWVMATLNVKQRPDLHRP